MKKALSIARKHRRTSDEINTQFIEIVSSAITNEDSDLELSFKLLDQFQDVVYEVESALGAQAIGWNMIAEGELNKARDWFDQSIEWEENEGAVIGLAVRAAKARHFKTMRSIVHKYRDDYPALRKFL